MARKLYCFSLMVCDNTSMNVFKKSLLGLCALLLTIVLFLFGLVFGLNQIFGTPDALKSTLKESGFYQSVVGDALDQAQKEQSADEQNQIPIDNPEVRNVIKSAASPEFLQSQVEGTLDSVYAWLQGKTPKLTFSIPLGDTKTKLADGLYQYAERRLASLPACAPGAVPNTGVDPFSAACLPQGVGAAAIADEARNKIMNGDFMKDTTITADSLRTGGGKTLEEQLQALPAAYQGVRWATFAAGFLALLLAAAVVLLSVNWRSGLKKVGIIFVVVGGLTAAFSRIAGVGLGKLDELAKEPLQLSGVKVGQALGNDLRDWWLCYGTVLIALGAVTLIVLHFTRNKTAETIVPQPEPTGEALPAAPAPAGIEPRKQKPKPVKKLIQ